MTTAFELALRSVFPNSSFLWHVPHPDAMPVGWAIAKAPAVFYSILAAAYTAPKRHFAASIIYSAPSVLISLILGGLFAFTFGMYSEAEAKLALVDNIETIAIPLLSVLACWVVYRAESRPPCKAYKSYPAWRVVGITVFALGLGAPLLWYFMTIGHTMYVAIIAKLSVGVARVVLWILTVTVFVPITVYIHIAFGGLAFAHLSRLPSRITVSSLVAIFATLSISQLIRNASGFPQ